jgi:hypothetical protein
MINIRNNEIMTLISGSMSSGKESFWLRTAHEGVGK